MRGLRVERLAGQRPFVDQPRRRDRLQQAQHLHREHADLHLGQAEDDVIGRDRHVGHAQQAHAAGHADAADPRDRGLGGVLRQPQQIGVIDIRPGKIHRERRAGVRRSAPAQNALSPAPVSTMTRTSLVVMRLAIAAGDAGDDVAVERVALVRPVDGDPERLPALVEDDAVLSVMALLAPFAPIRRQHLRGIARDLQAANCKRRPQAEAARLS